MTAQRWSNFAYSAHFPTEIWSQSSHAFALVSVLPGAERSSTRSGCLARVWGRFVFFVWFCVFSLRCLLPGVYCPHFSHRRERKAVFLRLLNADVPENSSVWITDIWNEVGLMTFWLAELRKIDVMLRGLLNPHLNWWPRYASTLSVFVSCTFARTWNFLSRMNSKSPSTLDRLSRGLKLSQRS